MSRPLAGRRALVTGASRGIGAGIARRLAAEGADVAVVARTAESHPTLPGSLRETRERLEGHGVRVLTLVADLGDEGRRGRLVPEAAEGLGGPIDILVNNAAAAIYQPLVDYPLRRRRLTFEINFQAPIDLMQAAIPGMVSAGEGWIVNLSSATGRLPEPAPPGDPIGGAPSSMGIYGASKAALNRVTVALAKELQGTGVRVNTLEPRAAVLSEGANALVGATLTEDQIERMEAMVEAAVALCRCEPARTGRVHVSLDLLAELGVPVRSLDVGHLEDGAP